MKRIFTMALICIALVMLIVGCSPKSKKPKDMSQKAYDTGCEVVNILEHYLDMDIDASKALSKLNALNTSFESTVPDAKMGASIMHAILIMSDINSKRGNYSDVDVRNQIKEIKEILGNK